MYQKYDPEIFTTKFCIKIINTRRINFNPHVYNNATARKHSLIHIWSRRPKVIILKTTINIPRSKKF